MSNSLVDTLAAWLLLHVAGEEPIHVVVPSAPVMAFVSRAFEVSSIAPCASPSKIPWSLASQPATTYQVFLEVPAQVQDADFRACRADDQTMCAGAPRGLAKRVIACLDVRSNDAGDLVVTKGDQYDVREKGEGQDVRNLGQPVELAGRYAADGADEVTFLNITGFRDFPLGDLPMLEVGAICPDSCLQYPAMSKVQGCQNDRDAGSTTPAVARPVQRLAVENLTGVQSVQHQEEAVKSRCMID